MKTNYTLDYKNLVKYYSDIYLIDISKNGLVVLTSKLSLCKDFESKLGCKKIICNNLHICQFYLLGQCKFNDKCNFGHDLSDSPNKQILIKFHLQEVVYKELATILNSNKEASFHLVPMVCRYYNKATGCSKKNKCHAMHVCYHYMLNDCKFNKGCNYSHNIYDDQPLEILKKYNIDVARSPKAVIDMLRRHIKLDANEEVKIINNTSSSPIKTKNNSEVSMDFIRICSDSESDSADSLNIDYREKTIDIPTKKHKIAFDKKQELCTFALRDKCTYRENCMYIHPVYKLPYLWIWYHNNVYENFSENECQTIEKEFCNINSNSAIIKNDLGKFEITFDDENYTLHTLNNIIYGKVQRFGTKSQPNNGTVYEFLTVWKWYVYNEANSWTYINDMNFKIKNYDLEEFKNNNNMEISGITNIYSISLSEMKIKMKNGIIFKMRRRPELYKSNNQTAIKIKQINDTIIYPSTWNFDLLSDNNFYQTVEIDRYGKTTNEFKEIEKLFLDSLNHTYQIQKIHRIQNAQLWDAYQTKKKWMTLPNEKRLFHVTNSKFVDAICQQGFDFRLAGNSAGTFYGRGSYFALKSSYCDKNYQRLSGVEQIKKRQMIVAKVLVGNFTKGHSSYVRPPRIDPSKIESELYNSCVDNIIKPEKFVIFEHNQSYPEYVITYNNSK